MGKVIRHFCCHQNFEQNIVLNMNIIYANELNFKLEYLDNRCTEFQYENSFRNC